ncbi:hypothetical protein HMI55_001637 [Coelomomyces lativittatus]|nr:hypothetical protein HMI56_001665 [Coelomomyces lativittatus]KAJ1505350.1 hypothetical protein HMI55_001637 [Coelomomyces lativittatus]
MTKPSPSTTPPLTNVPSHTDLSSSSFSSTSDSLKHFPIQPVEEKVFQPQTSANPWQRIKTTCAQQPWVPIGFGSSLLVVARGLNAIRSGDSKTGQKMLRVSVLIQFTVLGCAVLWRHHFEPKSKLTT